jgi:Uma2 family endonuclease
MATSVHIPLGEYLKTTYRPDRDYVDGELQERNLGQWEHAQIQAVLAAIFHNHRLDWNIRSATELRVRVAATRVRIPDLTVVRPGPRPSVLVEPPLLAIEILSPDDSVAQMIERCGDYQRMGVATMWIINPMARNGLQFVAGAWHERTVLDVPGTPILLNLSELWDQLEETAR